MSKILFIFCFLFLISNTAVMLLTIATAMLSGGTILINVNYYGEGYIEMIFLFLLIICSIYSLGYVGKRI